MNLLIFTNSLVIVLTACGNSRGSSELKDVATNISGDKALSTSYLFYQEGDKVFRAACPVGTVVSDRAHCKLRLESVPATPFFTKLADAPGLSVPEQEKKVEELYGEIAKTDARLLTMIPQSGDAAKQDQFTADIDRLQADVAATAILLSELDVKIVDVQKKLNTTNDPNLADQMVVLQTRRAEIIAKKSEQQNLLNERRRQYVEASQSLMTEPVFKGLQLQRQTYELRLKVELEKLNTVTLTAATLNQLRASLGRPDFHFDILAGDNSFGEIRVFAKLMFQTFSDLYFGPLTGELKYTSASAVGYQLSIEFNAEAFTHIGRDGLRVIIVDDVTGRSCDVAANPYSPSKPLIRLGLVIRECVEFGFGLNNSFYKGHVEISTVDDPDEKIASKPFRKPEQSVEGSMVLF